MSIMLSRRSLLASSVAVASTSVGGLQPGYAAARGFPHGFLWGAATAGHQVEGNDTNSDTWLLEDVTPTTYAERVGDACNSFELWRQDIDLVKKIGLNAYRFSIEWSRIEPEQGYFSIAMLDYYAGIIAECRERGIAPIVTFNHFSLPVWFAAAGAWTNPQAPALFARFCEHAARRLASGIAYALTLNEPNGAKLGAYFAPPAAMKPEQAMMDAAGRRCGSQNFDGGATFDRIAQKQTIMLQAHRAGFEAIKSVRPELPVGFALAAADDQKAGPNSIRDARRQDFYGDWLETAKHDDFIAVQNYITSRWTATGIAPPRPGAVLNPEGQEVTPESLANVVRYVQATCGKPVLVTEHGLGTPDDRLRSALIPAALAELQMAIAQGADVIGYMHWSLMDNFEWSSGYKTKFGLASVNRLTFERTLKPSAAVYRKIALQNAV